jgi:hypothetical protein
MRGKDEQQLDVFSYISPEQRVPQDHPLRSLRAMTDKALRQQMSSDFFPITCTEVNPKNFILDATPFTVNLTMYGYNNTPQNLTLTVDSANWHTVGKGRYAEHIGAAEIAY